ncbi:hypothetical protein GCM10010353_69010 [Streptomyces chryseus]|nr:hypothetical protein GCM10010353_69010 [Streptomyces chryseus]
MRRWLRCGGVAVCRLLVDTAVATDCRRLDEAEVHPPQTYDPAMSSETGDVQVDPQKLPAASFTTSDIARIELGAAANPPRCPSGGTRRCWARTWLWPSTMYAKRRTAAVTWTP